MSDAQKRLSEIEAEEKRLAEEKATLIKESKADDLALVRKLCKQHGFTATQLRGCLKTRGKGKSSADGSEDQPNTAKTDSKKSKSK